MDLPMTAKQQRAYDLKKEGKTYHEIAAMEGVSHSVICKRLQVAYRKTGLPERGVGKKALAINPMAVEYRDPEAAAAMLDAASDPLMKVKDALKAVGLPERVSEAMLKRLRTKFYGAVHEAKALKTNEILRMIEEKIDLVGFYLDDKVMAEASARDLMLGGAALIEKRQLLRGEPTQIISDLERKKLNELLPLAIAEVNRRGLSFNGTITEKVVEPAPAS